MQPDVLF